MSDRSAASGIPPAEIYILQGDDELAMRDYLNDLVSQLSSRNGNPIDISRLDAGQVARDELVNALNALSLLSSVRLVVIEQAMQALQAKDARAWFAQLLKGLPQTTLLVLLLQDSQRFSKGAMQWEQVPADHWLHQVLAECGKVFVWEYQLLPGQREMPAWIISEAVRQGGRFEGSAAAELANLVGNNLFQARHEITKALDYVGSAQSVTRDHVRLLCSQSREEDVFEMVDALAARNAQRALNLLQRLLRDLPAQYIFSMLARQARLLIMARQILEEGGGQEHLTRQAHLHAFVAKKAFAQCRSFNMPELLEFYRQLDRMDEDSKTGSVTLETAMQALVARLCHAA